MHTRMGEHWTLIAELTEQVAVLAEHVRCGTSSLTRLRRLQERLEWEGNRVQVEIINRYLTRKGVKREKTNGRPVVLSGLPAPPRDWLGATSDTSSDSDSVNDNDCVRP